MAVGKESPAERAARLADVELEKLEREQPTQMEIKSMSPLVSAEERLNDALYDLQQAEVALRNARAEEKRARADLARVKRLQS